MPEWHILGRTVQNPFSGNNSCFFFQSFVRMKWHNLETQPLVDKYSSIGNPEEVRVKVFVVAYAGQLPRLGLPVCRDVIPSSLVWLEGRCLGWGWASRLGDCSSIYRSQLPHVWYPCQHFLPVPWCERGWEAVGSEMQH